MNEIEFVLVYYGNSRNCLKSLYSHEVFSILVDPQIGTTRNPIDQLPLDELIEMWKKKNEGKGYKIQKMIGIPYDNDTELDKIKK